jgi:hypothetical protein
MEPDRPLYDSWIEEFNNTSGIKRLCFDSCLYIDETRYKMFLVENSIH